MFDLHIVAGQLLRSLANQRLVASARIKLFLARPRGTVKVYLDDTRRAPRGSLRARVPDQVIELVKPGRVSEVSLDHDLGLDAAGRPIEGYAFVAWLEAEVAHGRQLPIPELKVHSANVVGHARLLHGIELKRIAAGTDPRFPPRHNASS